MSINQKLKMAIIALCAVLLLPLVLVNCERVNDVSRNNEQNFNAKFEQTGAPYDYVFVNPKWELVNADYVDEFGNVGKLYKNLNNLRQERFDVFAKTKYYSATCPGATGTYSCITDREGNIVSETCSGEANNCKFSCKGETCTLVKLNCDIQAQLKP